MPAGACTTLWPHGHQQLIVHHLFGFLEPYDLPTRHHYLLSSMNLQMSDTLMVHAYQKHPM